jgi:hypothetical protein
LFNFFFLKTNKIFININLTQYKITILPKKKEKKTNEAFVDYGAVSFGRSSFAAAVNNEVSVTPKCWKTIYHLYATMPETKTIAHR